MTPLRTFREHPLGAVTSSGLLAADVLEDAQGRAEARAMVTFDRADHGRFHLAEGPLGGALDAALAGVVSALVAPASAPTLVASRLLLFGHGDYSLSALDAEVLAALPASSADVLEVVVDLSREACGEAEVVWTHRGAPFLSMPQRPGEVAIVRRGASTSRFDRYLTHRVGAREVRRLQLFFV